MVQVKSLQGGNDSSHSSLGVQGKGQGKLRIIIQETIVLKLGIIQCLRRNSPTKGSQVHTMVAMIEISSPELRETIK